MSARTQIAGVDAIASALQANEPVRVLLVERDDPSAQIAALVARAQERGVLLWRGSAGDMRRMSRGAQVEVAIAMLGPAPETDLEGLFARGGAVWLLHRASYPSNVGFAIRTAEVSGAAGIVVDAAFNHAERGRIEHVSMGADRVMPVLWETTDGALQAARAHGHRIFAIEDSGERAPWQVDLRGNVMLLLGSEREGLDADVIARCNATIGIPMNGFVPSYNLQAAMSMLVAERLRQLYSNHISM